MTELWFPDGPSSRAVLIGAADFQSAELPAIAAVRNNLRGLRRALTDDRHGLLASEHCQALSDPSDQRAVGAALAAASGEATDLLLVYYCGHGLLDDEGMLHLALTDTDPAQVGYTAVALELLKRDLARSRARARVLVLDCCFSGRAVAAMTGLGSLVSGQLDLFGTYTLTSSTANTPSHAPPGERYTAFTGAVLRALASEKPLSLDGIYARVDSELAGRGLPRPQRRSVNTASELALVRGPVPVVEKDQDPVADAPPTVARYPLRKPPSARAGSVFALIMLVFFTWWSITIFWGPDDGGNFDVWSYLYHEIVPISFLMGSFVMLGQTIMAFSTGQLVITSGSLKAKHSRRVSEIDWDHVRQVQVHSIVRTTPPTARTKVTVLLRPDARLQPGQPFSGKPATGYELAEIDLPQAEFAAALAQFAPDTVHVHTIA